MKTSPTLTSLDQPTSKADLDKMVEAMNAVSDKFYAGAVHTRCHPFIEFCGLMKEYISVCQGAAAQDIDFSQASQHTGVALPIKTFHANYIGEKLGCIYGPSFRDPTIFKAFVDALDLPFEVVFHPRQPESDEEEA